MTKRRKWKMEDGWEVALYPCCTGTLPFLKMVGWLWEDFRLFCFVLFCLPSFLCIAVATPISLLLSNDPPLRPSHEYEMDDWMDGWMIGMIRNMSHVDNEKTPFCALYTSVHILDTLEWLMWLA